MQSLKNRVVVLAPHERARAKVRIPQSLRKLIHVYFAMGIARNRHAVAGITQ